MISTQRLCILALGVLTLGACERAPQSATSGSPPPGGLAAAAPAANWDDVSAGPVLFVAGSNETETVIVFPHFTDSTLGTVSKLDTGVVSHTRADLFARAGLVGQATIAPTSVGVLGGDCTAWPSGHVRSLDRTTGGVPGAWTVGFVSGRATAIPVDSMPALSPVDSARRAVDIIRVAASLANDTAPAFKGLPYDLQRAHRFALAPGVDAIVAILVRRVNLEATPREEHILLIAERDTTGTAAGWVAGYSERTSGSEDDVESNEILAVVRLGSSRMPSIIVSRDYGDGGAYSLIDRTGTAQWRLRWSSAYTGC